MDVTEPDELLRHWARAGSLPMWCRALLVAACGVTVVLAGDVRDVVAENASLRVWVTRHFDVVLAIGMGLAFLPRCRVSRFVRLAVGLPVLHLAATCTAWALWWTVGDHVVDRFYEEPLPLELWKIVAGAAVLAVAGLWCTLVVSHRLRVREWLHTTLVFALVLVLALGAWLPIACAGCLGTDGSMDLDAMFVIVVSPALLIAGAMTVVTTYTPALLQRHASALVVVVLGALVVALGSQTTMTRAERELYRYFAPLVLVVITYALVALIASGAAEWLARHRAVRRFDHRRARSATIATEPAKAPDEPVVELELASWLRAPRVWTRSFTALAASGPIPVDGADVLVPIPALTTCLALGERLPILRAGQRIAIHASDVPVGDAPFRAMPRADDVIVATPGATVGPVDVMLLMWRPCVAYLAILLAVALPAVLAFASPR